MYFNTNKQKGNTGLGMAIAYFTSNDYTVSIPLNDTQDYDLIIEKNNVLNTVQVKATGCKTKYGIYQVALKSCGGTKGDTYKTVVDTKVDYLFIFTEEKSMFLIPCNKIINKSTLNLSNNYLKYEVRM
ncbi:MAG: hypothetical protein IKK43_06580 [Clostridia bacterium]|nr:hypothetical protein [Clostridia bacterium]